MNSGVPLEEWIKWWDVLDALPDAKGLTVGLRMARYCRHPDAQWLASLFTPGSL
jgi:hypothetical protein